MVEGVANVFARHTRLATMCREGVTALGVTAFHRRSFAPIQEALLGIERPTLELV